MGYLNKETVTVDAILTKKGRELLAQGQNNFVITKFAVADDEVDYGLYDTAHPLGSEYYGSAIENMPVVEASPDETQNLRYKLVSLTPALLGTETVNIIPSLRILGEASFDSLTLTYDPNSAGTTLEPETSAGSVTFDTTDGYTLTIFDSDALAVAAVSPVGSSGFSTNFNTRSVNTLSGTATVVVGTGFTIKAKDVSTITNTQITIVGNESGATLTIPVTVNPETTT